MDVLCLPKREFGLLAAQLPELKSSFERLAQARTPRSMDGAKPMTDQNQHG
jgi:hypothetical protein